MTYIVVTNDDGVQAPGILALAQAMKEIGDVRVAAPSTNQSATGHKKTLYMDIPFSHTALKDGTPALSIGGSPADCIAVAALGALDWPPDIVVSGINRGANMGQDVTYSGTVSAALEASIHGVPAVAVSLDNHDADDPEDYRTAAEIAVKVVKVFLEKTHILPPFTILNVNVPNRTDVRGIRLVRQGIRIYHDILEQTGYVYQIAGDRPSGNIEEAGTDMWAVHNGYASLTPIHLDLTAHRLMADIAAWDITL